MGNSKLSVPGCRDRDKVKIRLIFFSFSWLTDVSEQNNNMTEVEELPVTLPTIVKDISTHISTLETLLSAGKELNSAPNRNSTESIVSLLNDKVGKARLF